MSENRVSAITEPSADLLKDVPTETLLKEALARLGDGSEAGHFSVEEYLLKKALKVLYEATAVAHFSVEEALYQLGKRPAAEKWIKDPPR